jgi:ubiquinol-cytochrome c reductase cytochrome c subunit
MKAVRRRRKLGIHLGVSALLFLPAAALLLPARAEGGSQIHALAETRLAQAGRVLYEERCASCHGPDGAGTESGPSILGLGPAFYDFMMSTGRMPLAKPVAQANRRPPALSPAEIQAISAFLLSLAPGGEQIPQVTAGRGDLSRGSSTYQLDCAPCHGTSGNGGAVGTVVAPELHAATATQIAEAVRIGPGVMPVFDETTISRRTLDSLVRYVLYLRNPDDRGGAGLDHIGPLIEGFLALTVGLGLVVLVTRYTGERS